MRTLLRLAPLVLLASCASSPTARILPQEGGDILAVATAKDEIDAAEASTNRAFKYCREQKKIPVFLDEKTKYQGALTGGIARTVKNVPGLGRAVTSDEDFRVTMRFRCKETLAD